MIPQLLGIKAVAERLGLSPKTLYQYVELREIPHVRVGRRVLFDERELTAWLETKTVRPRPPRPPLADLVTRPRRPRRPAEDAGKPGPGAGAKT